MKRLLTLLTVLIVVLMTSFASTATRPIAFQPTGTGLFKSTAGAENAAASLLTNADVDSAAAIGITKLALCGAGTVFHGGGVNNSCSQIVNADVDNAAAIVYSKLGTTGTETVIPQQFDSNIDSKGTLSDVQPKHVLTTDATVTTIDSFTLGSNTGVTVTWTCVAVKSDMTQGASYCRAATFRNNAGTVAQVGTTQDCGTLEDDATWDDTIDNSTTTIRNRVTGKAATNITWSCVASYLKVIP